MHVGERVLSGRQEWCLNFKQFSWEAALMTVLKLRRDDVMHIQQWNRGCAVMVDKLQGNPYDPHFWCQPLSTCLFLSMSRASDLFLTYRIQGIMCHNFCDYVIWDAIWPANSPSLASLDEIIGFVGRPRELSHGRWPPANSKKPTVLQPWGTECFSQSYKWENNPSLAEPLDENQPWWTSSFQLRVLTGLNTRLIRPPATR